MAFSIKREHLTIDILTPIWMDSVNSTSSKICNAKKRIIEDLICDLYWKETKYCIYKFAARLLVQLQHSVMYSVYAQCTVSGKYSMHTCVGVYSWKWHPMFCFLSRIYYIAVYDLTVSAYTTANADYEEFIFQPSNQANYSYLESTLKIITIQT